MLAEQPASAAARGPPAASRGPARPVREAPGVTDRRVGASALRRPRCPATSAGARDRRGRSAPSASSWCCACPCRRTGRGCLFRSTPSSCSRASRSAALPATWPADSHPRSPTCRATTSSSPRTVADLVARAGQRRPGERRGARARPSAARARARRARDQARARRRLVGDLQTWPASARASASRSARSPGAWSARCDEVVTVPQPESPDFQGFPSDPGANICSCWQSEQGIEMEKESLELLLGLGLTIDQIAQRTGKAPSTVSYWIEVHGLAPVHRDTHARPLAVDRASLERLVAAGRTVAEMAAELGVTTVRSGDVWLASASKLRRRGGFSWLAPPKRPVLTAWSCRVPCTERPTSSSKVGGTTGANAVAWGRHAPSPEDEGHPGRGCRRALLCLRI